MCSSWLGKEGREIAAQSQDQSSVLDEKGLLGGSVEVQDCSQKVKSGNISRTSQCSLSGLWVLILWTWLFIHTFYLVFGNFNLYAIYPVYSTPASLSLRPTNTPSLRSLAESTWRLHAHAFSYPLGHALSGATAPREVIFPSSAVIRWL